MIDHKLVSDPGKSLLDADLPTDVNLPGAEALATKQAERGSASLRVPWMHTDVTERMNAVCCRP